MAEQLINTHTTKGLFTPVQAGNNLIKSDNEKASFYADLKNCKDSITMFVNIPAMAGGKFYLTFKSADGSKDKRITLLPEVNNLLRFTTNGIKDKDGYGHFEIEVDNDMSVTQSQISVMIIKSLDVENH